MALEGFGLQLRLLHPLLRVCAQSVFAPFLLQAFEYGLGLAVHRLALGLQLLREGAFGLRLVSFNADQRHKAARLVDAVDLPLVVLGEHEAVSVPAVVGGFGIAYEVSILVCVLYLFGHPPPKRVVVVVGSLHQAV